MSILLEVEDLRLARAGHTVLEIDRLHVEEGEILAVIGPNGDGKSTLLLALSRLIQPDSGQMRFRGQSLERLGDLDYRRRIGLVLQEPLLLDRSLYNNIALGLRFRGLPRPEIDRRVNRWLERLGIAPLKERQARRISGGEAQRANLARAFALQPELLLLDEPFSALDSPTRLRLLEDFQGLLAETGITTVFVTHDLDEALCLGNRVAVLLQGRLRQVGVPGEVFTAPSDPDVAAFVGFETVLAGKVLSAQAGMLSVEVAGRTLEAVGNLPAGRSVLICLRPEDITLFPHTGAGISSARNHLDGRVLRLAPQGALVRVLLDCGFTLVALITRASAQDLDLSPGKPVIAAFKASAIHLIPR